ncbi:MAG: hypothetical protein HRF49_05755 [bacterium]|jgi:hypothetical protein
MKYRFEKVERKITREEKKRYALAGIFATAILIAIILFIYGSMWMRIASFRSRVSKLGESLEAGKYMDACNWVRYRDRAQATAAARWAEVAGYTAVIEDMAILSMKHSANWQEWTADLKFTLRVDSGPNKIFLRSKWIREENEWVMDLKETKEYMPMDNSERGPVLDLLKHYSNLDLDSMIQSENPPGEGDL